MMGEDNRTSTNGSADPGDCLECRLVSGGGLMCASLYVGYHASRNPHPVGKLVTFIAAGALGGIAVSRLLKLPPFDKSGQKNAIG